MITIRTMIQRGELAASAVRISDAAATYVVAPGDSLSKIAAGLHTTWPALWWTNRDKIRNPSAIYPGQRLTTITVPLTAAQTAAALAAIPAPVVVTTVSYSAPSHASPAPVHSSYVASSTVSTAGMGSFQSCVISRESGGRTQVMNSTGHYGLYQFDYGTWVSGGGAGADFGHASAAEQDRVFASVYAQRGSEPWAPSDGC